MAEQPGLAAFEPAAQPPRQRSTALLPGLRRGAKLAADHEIIATSSARAIPMMKVFADAAGSDAEVAAAYRRR